MCIDTVDEGFAGVKEVSHGRMAVVVRDLFSHPAPEILNRIEVGTIGRQGAENETEFGGGNLNGFGSMPGGAIPDDGDCARPIAQPVSHALQELNCMFFVTTAFVPDETLSCAKIVGAIPVNAIREGSRVTHTPGNLVLSGPGVAQVHIAVDVGFIDIDQTELLTMELRIQLVKACHKVRTLLWVGFFEHFLALLPAQLRCVQNAVQRAASDVATHDLLEPLLQLFQRPSMTGQSMLFRLGFADNVHESLDLLWAKKGRRPPV